MVYQVSVLLRDFHVRVSWDTLAGSLAEKLGIDDIVVEKTGTFQCKFVFFSEADNPSLRAEISSVIEGILSSGRGEDDDLDSVYSVTVKSLSEEDMKKLKPATSDILSTKNWFSLAAPQRSLGGLEKQPESQTAEKEKYSPSEVSAEAPAETPVVRKSTTEGSLVDVTAQLSRMRAKLLEKVHGQRHAVNELTQGVFESELFSKNDTERKGPVATFLFMGPSGVGKTFLAKEFGKLSDRESLVVDMSEYSDNLANFKFNGEHNYYPVVTGFVRKHPNGILIFDEIEKAHINTIHLFLQILDAGQLMDQKVNREVSFRDTIIIMTTNAGSELYDGVETRNLSNIPRNAMINALKSEVKRDYNNEPVFPQSIITRMANGHIVLFNHLEPYALMRIVQDEIRLQLKLFTDATGIQVEFDEINIPALFMYAGGAAADARTLRGLARNAIIREIQDISLQLNADGEHALEELKKIVITIDEQNMAEDIYKLFHQTGGMQALVLSDDAAAVDAAFGESVDYSVTGNAAEFQKKIRGVLDFILLDPFCGYVPEERLPSDVEDIHSTGMDMFEYALEYYPETPIYILDTGRYDVSGYDTLLARGARGVLPLGGGDAAVKRMLQEFSLNALIGNTVYQLGRAGKYLSYNCAQYIGDSGIAEICFSGLRLKTAVNAEDFGAVTQRGENSSITFNDVVGCDTAKETLKEFCGVLDDPRKGLLSGKRIPKGVLLYGPPGTGKTMLAKAMANESNAMFLPASATSFFGSLVGQTEGSIRELFKKARRYAPSVIFIDEVDAIARRRTGSASTAHNEDALNTLLAEMDGFVVDEKRPVFILAATNYDIEGDGNRVLDPAFVRRFDRKIHIPLPETDARYELFSRCMKRHNIDFGEEHESVLRNMAERSGGMCNADIEMIVEMYVRAIGDGEPSAAGFLDTLDEYRFGDVKNHAEDSLRQTAYHEGGHALVSWSCGVKPLFLTIISRNNFGGYMETSSEGKGTYTFSELKDIICRCMGGRAAEVEVYGEVAGINTGASSDIQKARYIVRSCLTDYGMGETLFRQRIGEAGEALLQEQFERAKAIIRENRETLDALVELLLQEKCLDKEQMEKFFAEHPLK